MAQRITNKKGASNANAPNKQTTPRRKNAASNNNGKTGRKPADKKDNIKQAGQSNRNSRGEQNAGENSLALNIAPFILLIISVYLLVTFFISGDGADESVGKVGVFVKNIFYGLLGPVAILVPFFTSSIALFLKKDKKSGFFIYRLIFSVICLILYAAMFHLGAKESADAGYEIGKIFDNGKNSTGGGVLGGYMSIILSCVGKVGAWIFTISLSVVFSTFLFGYTPLGVIRKIVKLVRDYKTSKNGFERNIIVKTPDRDNRFKMKTHRYRIASHINAPRENINNGGPAGGLFHKRKKFQVDIPIDSPKGRKKNKGGIGMSDNPFANNFSEEAEKIAGAAAPAENTERPISYETPIMLPENELFGSKDKTDLRGNKNNPANSFKSTNFAELFDEINEISDIDAEVDEIFAKMESVGDDGVVGDIKVIESAPLIRGDEPDIETEGNKKKTKKTINFETSKMFEEETIVKKEYKLPPISYLSKEASPSNIDISEELNTTAHKLIDTLSEFGVKTRIYGYSRGPSITRYEISPDAGVKVSSIVQRGDDIALNLAAEVRIEAPIPGKAAIGIEVPNKIREIVYLRTLLEDQKFINAASKITIALGKDVGNNSIYSDIAKMPHLLIAGATGMGKSVCINSIITSILYKATPYEVNLILIDPKKVELNFYNGIPHLLVPVISDPRKAAGALSWAVNQMEERYMLIEEKGVRDFRAYNEAIADDPLTEPLAQIVIIIDELNDLMRTAPADVEQSVNRLAAMARAAGIHLIVATQRPSVDVITGLIKANIPTRIAFTVVASQDSRTIINMGGAEKLIGVGDMLYVPTGTKPIRVQGAYVSEKDVLNIVEFWKKQSDGQYDENILNEIEQEAARCNTKGGKIKDAPETNDEEELDKEPMLKPAIEIAIETGRISTSLLQTKLALGYARAARIINTMEKMNIIGPFEGSKPRKVLITKQDFIEMTMKNNNFE